MNVLIIDDEEQVLKMYSDSLKQVGFEVKTAPDGQTGMDLAKNEKPDVILLDIIMPRFNGLDALSSLKKNQETKNIPVFLLTNLPEEMSGQKGKELGAAGYLVKAEYDPQMIAKFLQSAVQKQNSAGAAKS